MGARGGGREGGLLGGDVGGRLVRTGVAAKEEVEETPRLVGLGDSERRRAVCRLLVHGSQRYLRRGFSCDAADLYAGRQGSGDDPGVVVQVLVIADRGLDYGGGGAIVILFMGQHLAQIVGFGK